MPQTLKDIKIPYPTEGVIRTAQLDDTVTPENSVQLAVNMNFDRIGAIQTRPGITEYADDLNQEIKNYGVLNNQLFVPGFDRLFKLPPSLEFSSVTITTSAVKIDDTHFILFWDGVSNHGFAQVFSADMDTGVVTALGSPLTFDATLGLYSSAIKVDSTHYLNFWSGAASDGFAQVFAIDGSYNVTAIGSPLEFNTSDNALNSCAQIDANHFINFYAGTSNVGIAETFTVNLSTWAVTKPGSPFTFDSTLGLYNSCVAVGDGTHFINFWTGGASNHGYVRVFAVNTGTWNISGLSIAFEFDANPTASHSAKALGDGQHFINFWAGGSSIETLARVFSMNLSTFAVTAAGAQLVVDPDRHSGNASVSMEDGQHFVNFWQGAVTDETSGLGQIFEVNLSTFNITAMALPVDTGNDATPFQNSYNSAVLGTPYHVVFFSRDSEGLGSGVVSVYKMENAPEEQNLLYAQKADGDVDNWDGATWTNRRTDLKTVSKARFSQFLNYLWMVNGNALIGDPVATSNGGDFGVNLVPLGFPPGDFIHAGFEGRVWVLDKVYGIIYYTDIVQFTPPDTYTLTYDADVNFIKDIAPQDGQRFTGVQRVPRALLIFTQDNIYRIYGATSIDAYPAYDVGTYSQESIVETKTGILFHHSSGFYQFDYGGQPVEISRRVIDFIKAIPRTQYSEITGVYDGFDAVEWAVGTVTVEGVTFNNCVMRYTLSNQVWTIYDYVNKVITAMISFDDGDTLVHLMGTSTGKTASMDTGTTDLGDPFYYECIDRWRSFTEMYSKIKQISGINVYSENAAGANLMYQIQKSPPNVWKPLGSVNENNNSLFPNASTDDFDVVRLRLAGNTAGTPVVVHGFEILSINDKGFDQN